jgi:hypothetical protein
MKHWIIGFLIACAAATSPGMAGCDRDTNEANDQLIGGQCATAEDCDDGDDETPPLECILDFKGGYCGREGCAHDVDCPEGSICVDYEGSTYCFLVCLYKTECNTNRSYENESNCSSNVDPVDGGTDKVCVPPSSG